jgi:hypothetical protein
MSTPMEAEVTSRIVWPSIEVTVCIQPFNNNHTAHAHTKLPVHIKPL